MLILIVKKLNPIKMAALQRSCTAVPAGTKRTSTVAKAAIRPEQCAGIVASTLLLASPALAISAADYEALTKGSRMRCDHGIIVGLSEHPVAAVSYFYDKILFSETRSTICSSSSSSAPAIKVQTAPIAVAPVSVPEPTPAPVVKAEVVETPAPAKVEAAAPARKATKDLPKLEVSPVVVGGGVAVIGAAVAASFLLKGESGPAIKITDAKRALAALESEASAKFVDIRSIAEVRRRLILPN